MKKKIIALAAALMMFMGVVSASSINGDYKGNPIVKVMSNGKQLQSDEVPAQIYDGHTVVPISLLRQLGVSVEWNQDAYSVDVKLPQTATQNGSVNLPQLRLDLIDVVSATDYSIDQNGVSKLTFALLFNSGAGSDDKFNRVMNTGAATGVDRLTLIDEKQDGYIHSYRTADMKDFINNKISVDEFKSKIVTQPKIQQTPSQPVQQNQPPIQQPIQQPVQQTPTNNGSNVQNGDNGTFQFIGVNDFYNEFGSYHIAGQIKNITGTTITGGITIIITLFDQNGNVVGTQTGIAQNAGYLKNGDTAPFDIMFLTVPKNYTRYEIKAKF